MMAEAEVITREEGQQIASTISDFMSGYAEKSESVSDSEWLLTQFKESMPEKNEAEITQIRDEIIDGIQSQEAAKESLHSALSQCRSKESWFAQEMRKAASGMSSIEAATYLQSLDEAVNTANQQLIDTITTKSGAVSKNQNLDGFIAEDYHAQTFNLNAAARGSHYRARVLKPNGKSYTKNSVDIVIDNLDTGRISRRYQAKYGATIERSRAMYKAGNYRGQRLLTHEERIVAPDGTTSNILSKQQAKELQEKAQSGEWQNLNWNEYAMKDIAAGIAKNVGIAGAQGLLIGTGFELARQIYGDKGIDSEKLIETGLETGADFAMKVAVAGGLKVASEKGFIKFIPKDTPTNVFTTIAFVTVENVKVLSHVAIGELTPIEGFEKIEQVATSSVCGLASAAKGATIGSKVLSCFGPAGAAIGGFAGGTIGYMAGSGVATAVVKGYQKVRSVIVEHVVKPIVNTAKRAWENAKSFVSNIFSWL
ncbi:MAG: hypothetical protein IJ697_04170 [Synergistaceae bacterium]|nr:hypothetical protein [Synergistaceae bacterium]